jgi:hypothetical protein
MAGDDEVIPLQERIETAADDSELEEVYNTERPAVRGLHPRLRSAARDPRQPGIRVPA